MSKKIQLTQGKFAIVDDADYKWLNQWKWCAVKMGNTFYAVRNSYKNGKQTMIWMHRKILGLQLGDPRKCDHQDRNGLNNQRGNLRMATCAQNIRNSKSRKGTSQFKGVSWFRDRSKWHAQICVNRRTTNLGFFDSEVEAAQTYNKAAKMFFGEFAYINFGKD